MTPRHDVVVIGSIMHDLTLQCGKLPRQGQTVVGRLSLGHGGKGSNQAVASARAGAATLFIGAVGDDDVGDRLREYYRSEKIGHKLVTKRGCATGTAVILVDRDGENAIVIDPGANARLAPSDIAASALRGARVVLTQLEANLATTAHVLKSCHARGATTILNPAPMRDDFDPALLRHVSVLVPNETEFISLVARRSGARRRILTEAQLRGLAADELHRLCRGFAVPTVIVTLGRRGCFISRKDGHASIPAYAGMKVADTTGAGDAFCGGLAAGLVRFSGDLEAAARFGTAVAALSVTKPGAAASMPSRTEIEHFLKSR